MSFQVIASFRKGGINRMKEFPLIEITSSTPYERGFQYGFQAKLPINVCLNYYRNRLAKRGDGWRQVQKYAMEFVEPIQKEYADLLEEAQGIADGAGLTLADIMVINCRYEITKFPKVPECTTAAVLPEASQGKCSYAIKNWDYSEHVVNHIVILHIHTADGFELLGLTEAGQMIRDGFNNYGIAIATNNLQSVEDYPGHGIPVTFLRRRILSCKSFQEAENIILKAERSTSNNIMLIDGHNGIAKDFEWYPGGADIIKPDKGILTHANHFIINPENDALKNRPKNRDSRLANLLMQHHGKISVPYIMECMKDHKYYPLSICGHSNPEGDSYSKDRMTVSSMIVDFSNNRAYICAGPPCQGKYVTYYMRE